MLTRLLRRAEPEPHHLAAYVPDAIRAMDAEQAVRLLRRLGHDGLARELERAERRYSARKARAA